MQSIVLIVDDDAATREGLEAILRSDNYHLVTAINGYQGLEKAKAFSPDIILLDVMMPEMDGFEVCRTIRTIPEIAEVPILILTALDDRESLLMGLEAGADDFLTKPVNRYELRARVATITRLNRYRSLLKERQRIRDLTSQIIHTQEEERRRISQELHDEIGQMLTSMSIGLKLISSELPDSPAQERILEMYDLSKTAIQQLRHLGHELRPPALDMVGLAPTLEGYCRDFSRRTQLPILFSKTDFLPVLPENYNITLYRFLQEALTNVARHAGASQVWVHLGLETGGVTLAVRDDGSGFSHAITGELNEPVNRKDNTPGMGLLGMQERVHLLDGRLHIESQPGQGCKISVWLPVPNQRAYD